MIAMPVLVRGGSGTKTFEEETRTVSVERTAALVRLVTPLRAARKLPS